MTPFILGSSSPRRKEILNFFSIPFTVHASYFDESTIPVEKDPIAYAKSLAKAKLLELKDQFAESTILTADTIVYCNGKVYNKPKDETEAFQALLELQGKWHSVFTALCLYKGKDKKIFDIAEETRVLFNPLNEDQIKQYHSKIHFLDKSGSYTIQQGAGLI
ncbi:MAG TPA: nucleoside triphosphate pyrophosphatase, partial [Parachlamydiaceae bacterium]|nr:nucleoside triphosphate pyrophosphatase [Parachlamydiaceae bacterium]